MKLIRGVYLFIIFSLLSGCKINTLIESLPSSENGNGGDSHSAGITLSPSNLNIDPNRKYKFSGQGGTPPYTYSTTGGTISSNGVFTATGGGYNATITIQDSLGNSSTSNVNVSAIPEYNCDDINYSTIGSEKLSGIFYDPGGPSGNYSSFSTCFVSITSPDPSQPIRIEFLELNTETGIDILEMMDKFWNPITNYSGNTLPSNANPLDTVLFNFSSNGSIESSGFAIKWSIEDSVNPLVDGPDNVFYGWTESYTIKSGVPPYSVNILSGTGTINSISNSAFEFIPPSTPTTTVIRVTDALGSFIDKTLTVTNDALNLNIASTIWLNPAGGQIIFVPGAGILPGATVTINSNPCPVTDSGPDFIQCTAPSGSAGFVDITITNPDSETVTLSNKVSYRLGEWTLLAHHGANSRIYYSLTYAANRIFLWGGQDQSCALGSCLKNDGFVYNPVTDSWSPMAASPLDARIGTATAWTGYEIIYSGGRNGSSTPTGAAYNPFSDTWRSISSASYSQGSRQAFASVWTGNELIIQGGQHGGVKSDGAAYNYALDTWRNIPTQTTRWNHSALWTGTEMVVLGGCSGSTCSSAGDKIFLPYAYSPSLNTWMALDNDVSMAPRTSVYEIDIMTYTGKDILIAGGFLGTGQNGARYDHAVDTWFPLTSANWTIAESIWSGTHMVNIPFTEPAHLDPLTDETLRGQNMSTIGAANGTYDKLVFDGRNVYSLDGTSTGQFIKYDLGLGGNRLNNMNANEWLDTGIATGPSARMGHSTLWTGEKIIVWGGNSPMPDGTGMSYDPFRNIWSSISGTNAPSPRAEHSALWIGDKMFIWGGIGPGGSKTSDGALYDPRSNTWNSIRTTNQPSSRSDHTAIWTGKDIIIWGGHDGSNPLGDGFKYNPFSNSWSPISTTNAPSPRKNHSAIWTGGEMIIWGGENSGTYLNDGFKYNPTTDTWVNISGGANTPSVRSKHLATWTGGEMIIWGGLNSTSALGNGAKYNARNDSWTSIASTNAPSARFNSLGLFLERFILVGFGKDHLNNYFNDLKLYNIYSDTWIDVSSSGLSQREQIGATWLGFVGDGTGKGNNFYRNNPSGDVPRLFLWGGGKETSGEHFSDGRVYRINDY